MPASGTEKGATSRSPHELGARFRTGAVGRARRGLWGILACVLANGWVGPSHVQRELANQRARLAEPGAGAGAPAGPCRSGDAPVGTCPGRDSAARFPRTLPPQRASATPYLEPPGSSDRRAAPECFRLPIIPVLCGPTAWAAPCAAQNAFYECLWLTFFLLI